MNILLISRCPPYPLHHGDRLIPFHIARELAGQRHLIHLVAFYQQPEDLADLPRYKKLFSHVDLIREPRRSRRNYLQRMRSEDRRFPTCAEESWSPDMWHTIEALVRDRAFDVAHVFGGIQVYEYAHLVQQLPNIIAPYESYSLWLERAINEETSWLARWPKQMQHRIAASYESWMFESYDRVVVLTDHDARALKELNPNTPLIEIPNGVDIEYFVPSGYEPDEPTLLFIGNYDYEPNLDAALRLVRDIFPPIKQAVPKARLYLVGGSPPPELQAYASDDIDVTGRVPDVRTYFEYSVIFISPLRLGAGIKNKILEAMAMQTPVVATPLSCDGIPVMHGHHVLLGESDDELVDHVLTLLKDSTLRREIAINGRRLIIKQFTWKRVANSYLRLYQQVIKERRDRAMVGLL
ncbi:MAG: glycosyltransferase [Anaerolineae bacterium]|nr:glycosyltransferase [Anaerolineae bacterium]